MNSQPVEKYVLLAGAQGSIGTRYRTILDMMGVRHRDIDFSRGASFQTYYELCRDPAVDSVIIATPTETHLDWVEACCQAEKTFLCEKPLSKDLESLTALQKEYKPTGYTVCNYTYCIPQPFKKLTYDFYRTGKDGIVWDLSQLVYLSYRHSAELEVKRTSPFWSITVDGIEIPYREIEKSYHAMLIDFLGKRKKTWSFEMGIEMTKVCRDIDRDGETLQVSFQ